MLFIYNIFFYPHLSSREGSKGDLKQREAEFKVENHAYTMVAVQDYGMRYLTYVPHQPVVWWQRPRSTPKWFFLKNKMPFWETENAKIMETTSSVQNPVKAVVHSNLCKNRTQVTEGKACLKRTAFACLQESKDWGQAGLQWEGVPESKGAATEKALSCVLAKRNCKGGGTKKKGHSRWS